MTSRISERQLETLVKYLNELTGNPTEPYSKDHAGKYTANVGCYCIDAAYGGYKLVQIASTAGASRSITSGFTTKRDLFNKIHTVIAQKEIK